MIRVVDVQLGVEAAWIFDKIGFMCASVSTLQNRTNHPPEKKKKKEPYDYSDIFIFLLLISTPGISMGIISLGTKKSEGCQEWQVLYDMLQTLNDLSNQVHKDKKDPIT